MPSRIMGGSGGSGPLSELAAKKAQMEDDGAGVLMSGSVSQYMSEYVSQCISQSSNGGLQHGADRHRNEQNISLQRDLVR